MRRIRPAAAVLCGAALMWTGGCAATARSARRDAIELYAQSYVAAAKAQAGDNAGAAAAYRRAATLAGDATVWRIAEGEAWIDAGFVADGLVTLRAAADAARLDPTPRLRLARAIWFATGNRRVAEAEFATAAAQCPAEWRVLDAWTALLTIWDGAHAAAAKWEAAEGDLSQPDIARWRAGLAWAEAGVHRRALAAWRRIEQPSPAARARIAAAALEAGDLVAALAYSSPADPSIEGRRVHALVRERRREWADAVAAWNAVLALDPEYGEGHVRLGHILLLELDDVAAAETHVVTSEKLSRLGPPGGPLQRDARLLQGRFGDRTGDLSLSEFAYRDLHRMQPTPINAGRFGRAVWRRGGQDRHARSAIPLLNEAVESIDSPELWWVLAACHRKLEQWAHARRALRAAGRAGRPQADVDAALATLPPE